ncbi:phage holin family protein [Anaerovirgula multivorans]|nr:phage holin family protein [Anaerovirgula multivorans]
MKKQQLKLLANIIAVYMMTMIFPLIEASGIMQIILFGVVLWLMNLFLRPLLLLITLPINILTLGVFTLLVNTWLIMMTNILIIGVKIGGFWPSLILAAAIIVINHSLKKLFLE